MPTDVTMDYRSLPWKYDDTIQQGQSLRFPVQLTLKGTVIALTSVTYALTVSTARGGTSVLTAAGGGAYSATGIVETDATNGRFCIYIAGADTGALGVGTYFLNLVLTFPSGHASFAYDVTPVLAGYLTIEDNATS